MRRMSTAAALRWCWGSAFFFSDKISARKKIAGGGLLLVMVLSSWISDLDTIWHGFKRRSGFPAAIPS